MVVSHVCCTAAVMLQFTVVQ